MRVREWTVEHSSTLEHVEDEAFVLVKAAPRVSQTHGATVCCAAIDRNGCWVRLYPVSFRYLEERQQFGRWDRIAYRWRRPRTTIDRRTESRRVDDRSIKIVGSLPVSQRNALVDRTAVSSLKKEAEAGRSLALLRAEIIDFWHEKKSEAELKRDIEGRRVIREQGDMFSLSQSVEQEASPIAFKYRYRDDDGVHIGTCQDWETEATFLKRRRELQNESAAIEWMQQRFGVEWPAKGIVLAMGTHKRRLEQWLINGVIRLNPQLQQQLL